MPIKSLMQTEKGTKIRPKLSQSKVDSTEQKLLSLISSGELPAGQWLKQQELAMLLETSVTPLREALRRLEADGLVVNIPYQGVKVSEVSPEELRQLYLVQSSLQSEAVRLYVPRITKKEIDEAQKIHSTISKLIEKESYKRISELNQRFHMIICGTSHFLFLGKIIRYLWKQNPRDVFQVMPARAVLSVGEHEAILGAVSDRNAGLAAKLVKSHFLGVSRSLVGDGSL